MNRTNGAAAAEWDDESRVSRAEAVARRLEDEIRGDAIVAGQRLGTKSELRDRFHVAAGTLNEALRLLEMRALVQLRPGPGGGVFAASPSPQVRLSHLVLGFRGGGSASADCLTVRNALELPIALDAARHRTKRDLADLERILADMETSRREPLAFLKANWALHRRLAEISRNAVLQSIYVTLLDFLEEELEAVSADGRFHASSNVAVHRALIDAIASQDAALVKQAVRRHTPHAARVIP
jgi:DNA-binding FadR family transcriptional regulator